MGHMQAKTYSNDAMKPMGYAGKGMYHAESAGAVHIAKREAEADPALIYNSGVHHPMTYGLHNYGYTHYPYTTAYSHIFKREAEAEAEPQLRQLLWQPCLHLRSLSLHLQQLQLPQLLLLRSDSHRAPWIRTRILD